MTFTMPEALTTWRFLGFAHDPELRSGTIEGHGHHRQGSHGAAEPAPIPARRDDTLEFTVKVSNQSPEPKPAGCG
jgi:hypothetical protein